MKKLLLTLLFAGLTVNAAASHAATAVLAGGCFWCMESDFEKLHGVSDVVSGFTGGTHPDPQGILDHFWVNHDPFDARGQFCDKGHSYLAAIFVANDAERTLAEKSKQEVVEMFPGKTVVTPVLPQATFFPIKGDEEYHQDYYKKSPIRYKYYRFGCGRDGRLEEIWGDRATHS